MLFVSTESAPVDTDNSDSASERHCARLCRLKVYVLCTGSFEVSQLNPVSESFHSFFFHRPFSSDSTIPGPDLKLIVDNGRSRKG